MAFRKFVIGVLFVSEFGVVRLISGISCRTFSTARSDARRLTNGLGIRVADTGSKYRLHLAQFDLAEGPGGFPLTWV